jgi:quercetin dioxygenase-like cupin family protein
VTLLDPLRAAREAVAAHPSRPASAVLHDSPDARLLVFRIAPGQRVAPHRNASSVHLSVLAGRGVLSGEAGGTPVDIPCVVGDVVLYAPNELHAMRAESEELVLLATITPSPGSR